jgi:GDP-L-fucose synthase
MPALIKRIVDARLNFDQKIDVWGSGKATREFLYVEDAVEGIILAAERYNSIEPVNLGSSDEISIKNLVEIISEVVGYSGKINWDVTKPDGALRRKVDVSRATNEFGFTANTSLKKGIQTTVEWYINNIK